MNGAPEPAPRRRVRRRPGGRESWTVARLRAKLVVARSRSVARTVLRPTDKRPPEPWHGLDLRGRVAPTLTGPDTADLAVRHHVCELHIGASHLAWHASVGDDESLYWALRQLDELLESGPRRQPVDAP